MYRCRFTRFLATAALWLLPTWALAVVNVNLEIFNNVGQGLNVTELVLNPGADNQLRVNNRNRDNKFTGLSLNEGERVEVEATGTDGKKYIGTLTVPNAQGKPEIGAAITLHPKPPVNRSQSQSTETTAGDTTAGTQPRATKKKTARKKTARKKTARKKARKKAARKKTTARRKGTFSSTTVSQLELEKIPTARDPWALLQTVPGVQVDRINVGGNESGQQSNFTGAGSNTNDAVWAVDGVVITDMAAIGAGSTYYNFDAFEEFKATTGGSDIGLTTRGVTINLVTKRGTNEWRGSGRYLLTDDTWNVRFSADYKIQDAGEIDFTSELGELGGPIVKDKLWIWANYGRSEIDLLTVQDVADFSKLEDYTGRLNAQLSNPSSQVGFYHYGDKVKNGRNATLARPQETTWNQAGPTDIYKLEDTHIFNSNFYLTGLTSYLGGGFQLSSATSLVDLGTPDGSRGFVNNSWANTGSSLPAEEWKIDGNYFFNTGSVSHELKFGTNLRDNVGIDSNTFVPQAWHQTNQFIGGSCFPTSQGVICGGGPGREMEQDKPPRAPEQFMLQSPSDFTLEHSPANFGDGEGPKLTKGRGVKMLNYAWIYPGNWQTDVVMGPDQHTVARTAPTWLDADRVIMVDDGVGQTSLGANAVEFAQQLWRLLGVDPQPCSVTMGDPAPPSQGWMLLRTKGTQVHYFAIQLNERPGWIELDDKGRSKLFGHTLRYDRGSQLLWLIGGTTFLNREPVYSIDVGELGFAWASLQRFNDAFDPNNNPLRLCGTGKLVKVNSTKASTKPDTPVLTKVKAAPKDNSTIPFKVAKLSACNSVKTKVPRKVYELALQSPETITGAGYTCHLNAPPLPENPVRTRLTLRKPGEDYHPLFNPLLADCKCDS